MGQPGSGSYRVWFLPGTSGIVRRFQPLQSLGETCCSLILSGSGGRADGCLEKDLQYQSGRMLTGLFEESLEEISSRFTGAGAAWPDAAVPLAKTRTS